MRPRPYLSWSAMDCIERSPAEFIERYIYEKKMPITQAIAFGKKMADGLENGEATGDPTLDMMMAKLPKYECMDWEFRGKLKGQKKEPDIGILIKPDTAKKDLSAFCEYKTGKKWTQKMADESGQVTFYAAGAYLITGEIPKDIELVWVPTMHDERGKVEATGEVVRFKTKRTMSQIINMMVRMRRAWKKIEETCDKELTQ